MSDYGIPLRVYHLDRVATLTNQYSQLEDRIEEKEREIRELKSEPFGSRDHAHEYRQREDEIRALQAEQYEMEQEREKLVEEIEEAFDAGADEIERAVIPQMVADAKRTIVLLEELSDAARRLVVASETIEKQNQAMGSSYPAQADGSDGFVLLPDGGRELHQDAVLQHFREKKIHGGQAVGRRFQGAIPLLERFVRAAESWLNKRGMDVPELGDVLPEPEIPEPEEAQDKGFFDSLSG